MHYKKIVAHEADFIDNFTSIRSVKFNLVYKNLAFEDGLLEYVKCTPLSLSKDKDGNDREYFYNEKHNKDRITLHYTEGYLKGDMWYLTQQGHVSVPFTIARDGTIYNLFSSSRWSYHLGSTARGGNTNMSKSSIAIEFCNIGALTQKEDRLYTKYGDIYCDVADHEAYTFLPNEMFRHRKYFASFTEKQYGSAKILIDYLTKKYNIPKELLAENKRYQTSLGSAQFKGINTHINFRNDLAEDKNFKKTDIGPAFDWDKII